MDGKPMSDLLNKKNLRKPSKSLDIFVYYTKCFDLR